jgi:hypothetical protein
LPLAIRSSQISSVGKFFRVSKAEKLAESFYKSGAARLCPPDNSAHISAHNAVKSQQTAEHQNVTNLLRARQQERLEQNYQKAVRRAEQKGRKLPPRGQYYDHWGHSYYSKMPSFAFVVSRIWQQTLRIYQCMVLSSFLSILPRICITAGIHARFLPALGLGRTVLPALAAVEALLPGRVAAQVDVIMSTLGYVYLVLL